MVNGFHLHGCVAAGPLVGLEPKKIHAFCDLYEQARHSYRAFRGPELAKYLQHLSELKLQVAVFLLRTVDVLNLSMSFVCWIR